MIQLCRASDKAAKAQVQHIVLALTPDGEIHINGSGNMIDGMLAQPAILGQVKGIMIASQQAMGEVKPVVVLDYPLLPCSPYSPKWKGSPMIRGVLTKMVAGAGHGRNGRNQALGVGDAPFGWPMDIIQWTEYMH